MKKSFLILSLLLFIFIPSETFAFAGDYNYEVTSLNRGEDGTITVKGWGILNAGVDDHGAGSPDIIVALGSGSNNEICTGNKNNYYVYNLKVVPLDRNNNYKNNLSRGNFKEIGNTTSAGTNITTTLCHRDDNDKCVARDSSCYQNTGWSFTFNENDLNNLDLSNGYILYMTITAGNITEDEKRIVENQGRKWSVSFPLVIYKERITGVDTSYYNYSTNKESNAMVVKMVVYHGNQQATSSVNGGPCAEKICRFTDGGIYSVKNIDLHYRGFYVYQLDSSCECGWKSAFSSTSYILTDDRGYYVKAPSGKGYISNNTWAFSTWIAPPDFMTNIFPPIEQEKKPVDVNSCKETFKPQNADTKTINACSGLKTFGDTNETSCSGTNYTYYKKTCSETNNKVEFSVNGISGKSFSINNGGGFSVNGSVSTNLKCVYTFDYQKFIENYNNALYNLSLYANGSEDWYMHENIRLELEKILKSYIDMTSNTTSWSSNYDFSKLVANMTIKYNSGKTETVLLIDDESVRNKIDLNGDGIIENNYCQVLETKTINNKTVYTNVSCGESYQTKIHLKNTCLSIKTGEVVDCNLENVISGGEKFYVDLNETGGSISINVTNLGYDGNWKVNLNTCSFTTGKPLNEKIKFRQIELTDPFLQSYNTVNYKRGIGTNFKNNKYDFVNIIASDIWEKNYLYAFDMSKSDVEKIRKNTLSDVSKYLGSDCNLVGNYYRCAFIRDENYFTKIYNLDN